MKTKKYNILVLRDIFRLIRFPNLLIVALAMYALRLMLVEPLIIMSHQAPAVTSFNFFLMVFSTVLIAAGGYIINDIEDTKIDKLNQRENAVIHQTISRDLGYNLYLALTFIGVCIGFYLTLKTNMHIVAYVNLVSSGLLYFYSTTYKRQFLIGNIIVSLLTALSLAMVYLTEPTAPLIEPLKLFATGYVVFAFLTSMARELIKDMEDLEGDAAAGCNTVPVVAGLKISKAVAVSFIFLILVLLLLIQIRSHQWDAIIPFLYVAVFIEVPLIILLVSVIISSTKADFKRCSTIAKIIMVAGILSMPVFFYSY